MLILISLQSCFTYKSVNYNSIINEKNKKIKVTKIDKTNIKGRLISVNKKSMVLEKKGKNQSFNNFDNILRFMQYDIYVKYL